MPRDFGSTPANDNSLKVPSTAWVQANAWTVDGNAGTNPATQYIGTSDNQPVMFAVNGVVQAELAASGAFRLGFPTASGITGTERWIINDATGSLSDFSFVAAGGGYPTFNLGASGGSPTARTALASTGAVGNHLWWGYDGTSWVKVAEQIVTATSVATGNIPVKFDFNINGVNVLSMTSAGAAFTGVITSPTPATDDNSTKIATTAYVQAQGYLTSALAATTYLTPAVAAATYLTSATAATTYAPLASPALTGNPTAPTQSVADSSTKIATTAFCQALGLQIVSYYAPLASPALTGTPTASTAATNTNTTQLATTAFVLGQAGTAAPVMDSTAIVGTSTLFSRQDHAHPSDTTKAPLASPALTGVPTAPTAAWGTNTTQLATTAFVQANEAYALNAVVQTGTTQVESWYPAGVAQATATTTLALTAGRMYAMPFYVSQQHTIDRLGFNVTTQSSGQNARVGIYSSTNGGSLYPTALVYDSGSVSTTGTGAKNNTTAISQTLLPGLYWFVILASSTPTVVAYASTAGINIFGYANTLTGSPQIGLYVAQTYGSLPATFPTGATAQTSTFPAVFCRFSS